MLKKEGNTGSVADPEVLDRDERSRFQTMEGPKVPSASPERRGKWDLGRCAVDPPQYGVPPENFSKKSTLKSRIFCIFFNLKWSHLQWLGFRLGIIIIIATYVGLDRYGSVINVLLNRSWQ